MFDMSQMQKMQQQMETRLAQVRQELEGERITGSAGGGALTVVCDGTQEVLSVEIRKDIVDLNDEDREMLQDLMVAAINQAITQAKEISQKKMGPLTGGLNLPGL